MNIVFLDADTIGRDIDLSMFEKSGHVTVYGFSSKEEMRERAADADVLILNKMQADAYTLEKASHLKLICVTATGTNNLDKNYLAQRNIEWRNVAGYSTECVTQHTFAMLFYLLEKLAYYDNYVKSEAYVNNTTFTHFSNVFHELYGMTWGIIGLGAIGRRVAQIAAAFGCHVIYFSTSGKNNNPDYSRVSFDDLLSRSDIVSVHAPLTEKTEGLMEIFAQAGQIRHLSPASQEAQALTEKLRGFISENFYNCTEEVFQGLGQLYKADQRFQENIDRAGGKGTADFVSQAISVRKAGAELVAIL